MACRRRLRIGRVRRLAALASVAVVLAVGSVAGLSGAATAETGKSTFTVGIKQDVDSLNPFTGIVVQAYELYQLNYETLTDYDQKDFSAQPALASSWDTSPDGLTWTYHLRPGLKWSDGQPLTARDVVYTFNRIRNGKYERTNFGNYVASITSVEAPDDQTVVMKVKEPTPIMLHLFVYILPEHIWKGIDSKQVRNFGNEPVGDQGIVGSGPYIVKEHRKGQFLRLEANPHYWRGRPKVDEVVFRVFQNDDSLAQALRRGEIDFADDLGANVFNSLEGAPGVTTVAAQSSSFNEIAFNVGAALDDGTPIGDGHPALKDPKLRVALSYAIDRKTILDRVFGGRGSVGSSVIPPIYEDLHYDPGTAAYTFDPGKARQLLDQAGYREGPDGIRTMPDGGQRLSFRLFGRSDSQTSQQTVQFVAGWLRDVGIEVRTKIVSEDALTELVGQGRFDLFEWGWSVEPDPNYQLSTFTCANRSYKDGGEVYANLSDSFFCDEQYDALYEQQARQINVAERAATVRQMQKILYDQAPYIVTVYYDRLQAYRSDRFTGFLPQPAPNGPLLFYYGTYSYRSIRPVSDGNGATGGSSPVGSSNTGLLIGAAAAVVVVAGAAGLVVSRRRRLEQDVE